MIGAYLLDERSLIVRYIPSGRGFRSEGNSALVLACCASPPKWMCLQLLLLLLPVVDGLLSLCSSFALRGRGTPKLRRRKQFSVGTAPLALAVLAFG